MREILFRGKDAKTGIWRKGYYVKEEDPVHGDVCCIVWAVDVGGEYPVMRRAKVLPETVSEWTGFVDRYGSKIFEGDILASRYLVEDEAEKEITYERIAWHISGWYQIDGESVLSSMDSEEFLREYSEVVGNIWENSDFLER